MLFTIQYRNVKARRSVPARTMEAARAALPGIDVARALQRLGLPYAAYEQTLFRFADGQSQTLVDLQTAFASGDRETARQHAHSLAGAAGNVSADDLGALAKRLELALKDQAGGYDLLFDDLVGEATDKGIRGHSSDQSRPARHAGHACCRYGGAVQADTPVPALSNLKIWLTDDTGADVVGDFYSKVVGQPTDNGTNFTVRFTSVSPECTSFLRGTLGASPGQDTIS